jgi:sarcosine oxidase subunit delta
MRIPCPHCGPRSHDEFTYYGDATVRRPTATGTAGAPEFYDYVYVRDNPHGPHRELWFHQGGCHEWLVVERDTRTHAIASAVPARAVFGAGESS